MPSNKVLDSVAAIAVTTTKALSGSGGHSSARFLVDSTVSAGAGDWTVTLYWSPDGTVAGGDMIALSGTLAAAQDGTNDIPLVSPYAAVNGSIPEPNLVVYTETTGGSTFTGTVYAFYGD
jgi:hypothetical protein